MSMENKTKGLFNFSHSTQNVLCGMNYLFIIVKYVILISVMGKVICKKNIYSIKNPVDAHFSNDKKYNWFRTAENGRISDNACSNKIHAVSFNLGYHEDF